MINPSVEFFNTSSLLITIISVVLTLKFIVTNECSDNFNNLDYIKNQ